MFVELHILQNFAPANLNRDDTGSPKDCQFGGYRRARVSSQCWKRVMRDYFNGSKLIDQNNLALRTKRLVDEVARRLTERDPTRAAEDARAVIVAALKGIKLSVDEDGKTQYLMFLGKHEIERVTALCARNWSELLRCAGAPAAATTVEETGKKSPKQKKREASQAVPGEIGKELREILDGGKAVDLALFGRMVADNPDMAVDAASQVAHAISTNRVATEFDYYSAIDDLKPEETAAADMLGTVEFNSACFYRYVNVDIGQLKRNLTDDEELARKGLEAFLRAAVVAVPTGKQNSMAAQNPPSFVMAVVRNAGLWSLANAFSGPVAPDADGDLVAKSIRRVDAYWGSLTSMYGGSGIAAVRIATLHPGDLEVLKDNVVATLDALISETSGAAFGGEK